MGWWGHTFVFEHSRVVMVVPRPGRWSRGPRPSRVKQTPGQAIHDRIFSTIMKVFTCTGGDDRAWSDSGTSDHRRSDFFSSIMKVSSTGGDDRAWSDTAGQAITATSANKCHVRAKWARARGPGSLCLSRPSPARPVRAKGGDPVSQAPGPGPGSPGPGSGPGARMPGPGGFPRPDRPTHASQHHRLHQHLHTHHHFQHLTQHHFQHHP